MQSVALIGLAKFEFPTGDVRLCDGGFIEFGSETYLSSDTTFGTIQSMEAMSEGVGDEVPALQLTLIPNKDATPGDLGQPGFQRSRCRFWIGEYASDTGLLVGAPDLLFDGQLDQCTLEVGRDTRAVHTTIVSTAERLFQLNAGNDLSDGFHQFVWPGELGEANATGLTVPVAWGAELPPRTSSGGVVPGAYTSWRPFGGQA